MQALHKQGYSRNNLAYKAPFQPFGSWFALISTGIITIFKGYDTFMPFTKDTFVTSYIGIPTFIVFWAGYKLYWKTSVIPLDKVDLVTGRKEILEEEARFEANEEAKGPKTRWGKIVGIL